MTWNPNEPDAVGLEWLPIHQVSPTLNSPIKPLVAKLTSTVSETVDKIWFFSPGTTGGGYEAYEIDVYPDGVFPGDVSTVSVSETGIGGVIGAPGHEGDGVLYWDGTDVGVIVAPSDGGLPGGPQVPAPPGFAGYAEAPFIFGLDGLPYLITFRYDGLTALTAGQHIVKITQKARVQALSASAEGAGLSVRPYLIIAGQPWWGPMKHVAAPYAEEITHDWWVHPWWLRSWVDLDLDWFDPGTGGDAAGWFVQPTGSPQIYGAIYDTTLEATVAGPNQRLAFGWLDREQQRAGEVYGFPGWVPITINEAGGGWAKAAGQSYRIALRRLTVSPGGKTISAMALEGPRGGLPQGDDPRYGIVNGWQPAGVRYDPKTHLPYPAPVDILEAHGGSGERAWAPSFALEVSGNTSPDSQPYVLLDLDSAVYNGVDWRSYFTAPASGEYPVLRVLLGRVASPTLTQWSITFQVYTEGGSPVGGPMIVTPEKFEAYQDYPGQQTYYAYYKAYMEKFDTPIVLTGSARYFVRALSDAPDPERGWRVETLESITDLVPDVAPPQIEEQGTFQGEDAVVNIDGVDQVGTDAAVVLYTLPEAPTGLAAVGEGAGCVTWAELTWSPTSLGGTFERYEIDRLSPNGVDWERVAHIMVEDIVTWADFESQRDVLVGYRIRTRRKDTACSDWSEIATTTVTSPCCGYLLTTNQYPDLAVHFEDEGTGERDYELPYNSEQVQFYMRDYQQMFTETENRGVKFKRKLYMGPVDDPKGMRAYDELLRIARDPTLPYVAVTEETGDRWLGWVLVSNVTRTNDGQYYTADVEVVETTDVPMPTVVVG